MKILLASELQFQSLKKLKKMLEERGLLTAFSPDTDRDADRYETLLGFKPVLNTYEHVDIITEITLELVTDLEPLEDLWKKFEKEAVCTVFQSWHWISCWHRHKSREDKIRPLFVIGREGSNPAPLFIWPLQIRKHFGQNILEWFGQSHSSYNMGLYRPDAFSKLTAPVLEHILKKLTTSSPDIELPHIDLPHIDLIEFSNQPEVWNGYQNPFCALPFSLAPNSFYAVELERNFENIVQKCVSAKSRSNLRRHEKKLRATGQLDIEHARTNKRAQDILETYFEQKDAQFTEQGITNVFSNENLKNFYYNLCEGREETQPGLHCHALKLDNDIQATCIGIQFQKRYYLLMLSMTTGPCKNYAPGRILMRYDIEACCTAGYDFYDMGSGAGQHKAEWSNHTSSLIDSMFPVSFRGRVLSMLIHSKRSLKRIIKNNKKLWTFAKIVRKRLKGQRSSVQAE